MSFLEWRILCRFTLPRNASQRGLLLDLSLLERHRPIDTNITYITNAYCFKHRKAIRQLT